MLIDEVHTPDSSRFWKAESLEQGGEPENWDKEYVRLWYARQNYRGDGDPPSLPPEIIKEASRRYVGLYEGLTGESFQPAPVPAMPDVVRTLQTYLSNEE